MISFDEFLKQDDEEKYNNMQYDIFEIQALKNELENRDIYISKLEVAYSKEIERLNAIINGINSYCFKRMAELDDIRERDKKLEDFCDNKINAFLEVREKIKELERSDKE